LPQVVYGYQLEKVSAMEQRLIDDPREIEVRQAYAQLAEQLRQKLRDPGPALRQERRQAEQRLAVLQAALAPALDIAAAEKALAGLPRDVASARLQWSQALAQAEIKSRPLNGMPPHAQQFAGDPQGSPAERSEFELSRRNFLALVFCLMVGTAALPHILIRYYTVPSVRQARRSVAWSVLFILLLYVTAPALAVLVKYEVLSLVVGTEFSRLPEWVAAWNRVDPSLLTVTDINRDGILQLNEMSIGGDVIVLAAPAIAGLPYVVSALVAAGGAGGGAVDGRRLAADHLERAEPRPVLQDDRSRGLHRPAGDDRQGAAAHRGPGGCLYCGAASGRYFVFGVGRFFFCRRGVFPGSGAGHLLEARHRSGGLPGHAVRAGADHVLHGCQPAVAAQRPGYRPPGGPVVGHTADFCGRFRRAPWVLP
jgi:hypothetical protein